MKTKIYFALAFVLIASLACGFVSNTPVPTSSSGSAPQVSTEQPEATAELNNQPCEANKWEVVPVTILSVPGHDKPDWVGTNTPPNGWNIVFVGYAIHNNSDLWGRVTIDNVIPSINTEGGFIYNTVGMQGIWMPSNEEIPAPITMTSSQTSPFGNGDMGKVVNQPMMYITDYIPPHFGVVGTVEGYTNQIGGGPQGWTNYQFYSIFKVAGTQKHLTLTFPDIKIDCLQGEAWQKGNIPSRTFDLENLKRDWKQYPTSVNLPDLGSTIVFAGVGGVGTVTIKNVQFNSGNVTVKFQFTSINQGAETSGTLNAYIVDSHGYLHRFVGGQFDAGPAATVDGQDLETLGGVPNDDHNMKIVFWIKTKDYISYDSPNTVFNFNR